jgi:thiomorpholine-carboxylate dehydrogenase
MPESTSFGDAKHELSGFIGRRKVTSSPVPILRGAWLKRGCHVNAVGACLPQWRSLDDEAMAGVVFVDSRAAALRESGDIIFSNATIYAELGEALRGNIDARAGETTVVKSLGVAIEDLAAALLVYRGTAAF